MSKITEFTPGRIKNIRPEIEAALAPLAEKYGVQFKTRNARYTNTSVTFKLEVAVVAPDGTVKTAERKALEDAVDLGMVHEKWLEGTHPHPVSGVMIRVTGFKPRNRSYPILYTKQPGGGRYKCSDYGFDRG